MNEKNSRTMSDIRPGRSVDTVNRPSVRPEPVARPQATQQPVAAPAKPAAPVAAKAPKSKKLGKFFKVTGITLATLAAAGGVVYLALLYYR